MQTQTVIIIVDYKGEKDTVSCLDSLARITPKEKFQACVVIVQNPYDRIAHHTLKQTIITLDHNPGFAGANNAGIERALDEGMEILILLNNDTTVDPKFLKPLVQRSQSGRVGMVSPKIYFSAGREFHHDEYADPERGKVIWYAGGVIDWHNVYAWHWGVNEVGPRAGWTRGGGPPEGAPGSGRGWGAGGGRGPGGGGGVVRQILEEGKDEVVTGAHASRWGGERVAAGGKRARGGAIVVTVDATEIAALEKPASLESLLKEITTGSPEIAYTVCEHQDARIAFGEAPPDAPAAPGDRPFTV